MSEVVNKVLENQEVVEAVAKALTLEEAKKVLNEKGIEATNEDMQVLGNVFAVAAEKGKELSEKDLESVAAGVDKKKLAKWLGGAAAVAGAVGSAWFLGDKRGQKKGYKEGYDTGFTIAGQVESFIRRAPVADNKTDE